ncbi:MAG: thiol:disulfide interchange protein, partial [Gammaproteobacteria bacterium]|nr:thiol:disulfide interchange protein [Gammaproteobacteria bacterium]
MKHFLRAFAAILLAIAAGNAPAADVLKPEQVFRYAVTAADDALVVRWTIEPKYYLYRERMSFESRTPGVELGAPDMPAGELHKDEYFGDMHIYRDSAEVRLPIARRAAGAGAVALAIKSQGCADAGLCYPPQVWVTNVSLPAAGPGQAVDAGKFAALLEGTPRTAGGPKDEPLPVGEAFRFSATLADPFTLRVERTIAPGYYLYRHTLAVTADSSTVQLGPPELPPGEPQVDEEY